MSNKWLRAGAATLALSLAAQGAAAQTVTAAQTVNKGDTAWMLIATALVLMMSVPGLALFYGGLVRAKNMLSVLTQVFAIVCVAGILWVTYGYSLAFTNGGALNSFVGGFDKAFLKIAPEGKTIVDAVAATFSNNVYVPELVYIAFQMTFAMITPALIVGAFAERIKFSALLLFTVLWLTFIYFPMAHMVWYWGGPDTLAMEAAKAAAAAGGDAAKAAAAAADAVSAYNAKDAGLLFQWGALDFAGGTVVHINAGIAGLVGALMLGKRIGYGRELLAPHSLTMTMIGASLLWVGWFGFNAGSNLEANGLTALAMMNTFVATCGAALAWLFAEWAAKGKPSLLGMVSGAIAGLVAVTPASGFAGPMGSIVLGLVAGVVCFLFVTSLKNALGYDDSLDVFGIHCVGGIIGALGTGVLVSSGLGGTDIVDYSTCKQAVADGVATFSGCASSYPGVGAQFWTQLKAVLFTLVWSGVGSAILFKLVDLIVGLRVAPDREREGLDLAEHGERAYTM
ncbi:MAG: ammonium transporter [Methylobacteriaceae bacterium]|nr:ammonium transporter [Methylobacteriaceae bacterium]